MRSPMIHDVVGSIFTDLVDKLTTRANEENCVDGGEKIMIVILMILMVIKTDPVKRIWIIFSMVMTKAKTK